VEEKNRQFIFFAIFFLRFFYGFDTDAYHLQITLDTGIDIIIDITISHKDSSTINQLQISVALALSCSYARYYIHDDDDDDDFPK
jgi:hypothetical protein